MNLNPITGFPKILSPYHPIVEPALPLPSASASLDYSSERGKITIQWHIFMPSPPPPFLFAWATGAVIVDSSLEAGMDRVIVNTQHVW